MPASLRFPPGAACFAVLRVEPTKQRCQQIHIPILRCIQLACSAEMMQHNHTLIALSSSKSDCDLHPASLHAAQNHQSSNAGFGCKRHHLALCFVFSLQALFLQDNIISAAHLP